MPLQAFYVYLNLNILTTWKHFHVVKIMIYITMNKRKQQAFYVFIGFLALLLINYPIIHHIQQLKTGKVSFILIYLLIVSLLVCLAGFILDKKRN